LEIFWKEILISSIKGGEKAGKALILTVFCCFSDCILLLNVSLKTQKDKWGYEDIEDMRILNQIQLWFESKSIEADKKGFDWIGYAKRIGYPSLLGLDQADMLDATMLQKAKSLAKP
jgi:hypothetical protein